LWPPGCSKGLPRKGGSLQHASVIREASWNASQTPLNAPRMLQKQKDMVDKGRAVGQRKGKRKKRYLPYC